MSFNTPMRDDERRFFGFNYIFVVETLFPPDTLTGKNLFHDLLKPSSSRHEWFEASYHHVATKKQFFELLAQIRRGALTGKIFPLLHLEGHGSLRGLDVGRGGDKTNIKWEDMAEELRKINAATKNNLLVVVGSCHGINIGKGIRITERAPYYGTIAPVEEVSQGEIEEGFNTFYDRILNTTEFDEAIMELRNARDGRKARFTFLMSEVAFRHVGEQYSAQLRDPHDRLRRLLGEQRLEDMQRRHGLSYDKLLTRTSHVLDNRDVMLNQWFNKFMMKDLGSENEKP